MEVSQLIADIWYTLEPIYYGARFAIGFFIVERILEKILKIDIFLVYVRHKKKAKSKELPLLPTIEAHVKLGSHTGSA